MKKPAISSSLLFMRYRLDDARRILARLRAQRVVSITHDLALVAAPMLFSVMHLTTLLTIRAKPYHRRDLFEPSFDAPFTSARCPFARHLGTRPYTGVKARLPTAVCLASVRGNAQQTLAFA